MSTTYAAFRAAVKAAVVAASGLHEQAVVWSQDGATVADPSVVLTVISDLRTNDVPVRDVLVASGDDYARTLSTMRDVAIQVRVESIRADAVGLADEILLKLGLAAPRALLEAECAVIDDGPLVDLRYRAQGNAIQARAFELFTRIVLEFADPTPVGTIGTVQVQGSPVDLPSEVDLAEDTIDEADAL